MPQLQWTESTKSYVSDCALGSLLADFGDVSSREAVSELGNEVEIDILGDGCLAKVGLENAQARGLVRKRNVDQLVETSLSKA